MVRQQEDAGRARYQALIRVPEETWQRQDGRERQIGGTPRRGQPKGPVTLTAEKKKIPLERGTVQWGENIEKAKRLLAIAEC